VHLRHTGKGAKFRVTRASLEAAGLIARPEAPEPSAESLLRLFREQAERLAAIEEQRFQLAGQLGAALERNRLLEERLLQLAATSEPETGFDASSHDPAPPHEPEPPANAQPAAPETAESSPAALEPEERTIGAKPAPGLTPKRAAAAFARLRGVIRRDRGQ
jgi:hypothetical protein